MHRVVMFHYLVVLESSLLGGVLIKSKDGVRSVFEKKSRHTHVSGSFVKKFLQTEVTRNDGLKLYL